MSPATHQFLIVGIVILLYVLPSIIAFYRGHASRLAILIVNIFGGWTVIGWLWAFIWALANRGASHTVIINNNR